MKTIKIERGTLAGTIETVELNVSSEINLHFKNLNRTDKKKVMNLFFLLIPEGSDKIKININESSS
jgi:hypothetical protein